MRTKGRGILGILLAVAIGLLPATEARAIEVGQKAPDFTLQAADGKQVKLADLLGKGPVFIYTFIQAFTSG